MIDLSAGIQAVLGAKKRLYPSHSNRASSLDDPCLRRLFYRREAWDKQAPIPDSLQSVFETGNVLEPLIARIAAEIGEASTPQWRIVGSQMPTKDALLKQFNITGTIDGLLQIKELGKRANWKTIGAVDIKTSSPNIYPRLNSYDDLNRYPWTRAYRGQIMLYSFAHDLEDCFILFVNKSSLWEMKFIHFLIDMNYLEGLLQKAKAVNEAIEKDEPPEGINRPSVCERCQWLAYCCPELAPTGNLKILDNDELEAILERMTELSEVADEYRDLEKQRDMMLTKGQDVAVGRFLITWKQATNGAWRKHIMRQELAAAE